MGLMPKIRILPLLGIAFIALIAYFVIAGSTPISNILPTEGKKVVTCDVTVQNKLASPLQISSYNCQLGNNCYAILSLGRMSLFSDSGYLQMFAADNAKSSPVNVEVSEQLIGSTSKQYELNVCTASRTGTIKLYDKKSQVLGTEMWTMD